MLSALLFPLLRSVSSLAASLSNFMIDAIFRNSTDQETNSHGKAEKVTNDTINKLSTILFISNFYILCDIHFVVSKDLGK